MKRVRLCFNLRVFTSTSMRCEACDCQTSEDIGVFSGDALFFFFFAFSPQSRLHRVQKHALLDLGQPTDLASQECPSIWP